jgi:hypothetical protein
MRELSDEALVRLYSYQPLKMPVYKLIRGKISVGGWHIHN